MGENDFPNILNIKIEIDDENLFVSNRSIMNKQKAQKIRNISLSGFQHKTAVIIDNDIMRLPDSEKREDVYYFLKPYDKEKANPKSEYYLPHLAINEHLYMSFAKNELKFDVPYTALCKKPQDDEYHFLVKYFDRKKGYKIHRKESATIMDISSEKKYGPTSEKLFSVGSEILDENDRLRMLEYYFYSFVIKHEDMHTKNISVLTVNNKNILAPLYDISTTGIYKGFKQETALKINGKLSNIKFNDFIILVEKANIDKNAFIKKANAILYSYIENMPKYIDKLKEIDLPIYDNARAYSKTKQLYDVMKTHYEKRLNELNNNGWFVDLGIKLTGKIEYGSKFVSNDVKSILEPQIEQPLLSTQNNNIDNDCDFKM